jgi:hypothetical protein
MKTRTNSMKWAGPTLHIAAAAVVFAAVGCASGDGAFSSDPTFAEGTGALVATLAQIPDDVRCLQFTTNDWHVQQLNVDVVPGTTQTIRIGPLNAGEVYLNGSAYPTVCAEAYYNTNNWTADPTSVTVQNGRVSPVTMTFRRLGRVDVSIDFENCDAGEGTVDGGLPCIGDGADGGVWQVR